MGADRWPIIAQADDVMRSEQWERIRADIELRRERASYQETFDESRPWTAVIRNAARSRSWWDEHCRSPVFVWAGAVQA
eukprot:3452429-Amphidinium_carterae.1